MLFGDHCLLGGVHAAHGRAVLLPSFLLGPGSAALDVCDLLGLLSGGGDDDVTSVGSGCAHDPLVLDCGDDVLESAVSVLGGDVCVPYLESGCGDDRSDLEDDLLVLVVVVDCSLTAVLGAESALALLDHVTVILVDDCDTGNGLCVGDVDCFPGGESELVLVRNVLNRTFCETVSASGTLLGVDVPCFLENCDLEVSRLSLDLLDLVVGQGRDVGVSVTIRHFRREDTCGTVVRRERLVQTAHHSTDGSVFLYQVDMDAPVCKIQGCLDSRNSSTDNQCRFTQIIASVYQMVFGMVSSNAGRVY